MINKEIWIKIRVKNISSGEILTGYVENKKKVLIRPKQF